MRTNGVVYDAPSSHNPENSLLAQEAALGRAYSVGQASIDSGSSRCTRALPLVPIDPNKKNMTPTGFDASNNPQ